MKWQYFPNNTNSSPHQPSWSPNLTVNVTLLSFVNAAKCNKCENVRWIISSISGRWSYVGNDRFKNTWYCGYCLSSYHTHTSLNHTSIQKIPVESYQYQTQTQSMAHIERHGNKIGENCTTSHALKLDWVTVISSQREKTKYGPKLSIWLLSPLRSNQK